MASTTSIQDNHTIQKITLKRSKRGKYNSTNHTKLRNNLLAGVGYLELANAGDFAANVWNDIPVPRHAMILMAIGGPIALLVSIVAARDFHLSWRNVSLLYSERKSLHSITPLNQKEIGVLGVNTRELGTELIDRMLMDLLLGIGALLVGTGTIMAIWGADHKVFEASNLLSGFIGNSFAAIFGVINAGWSGYLVYRFQIRYTACVSNPGVGTLHLKLRQRFRRLQWHSAINGMNGLVAGMASMVTARMWWGYVGLIPCVVLMIAGNLFWRMKLGYDRPANLGLVEYLAGEKPAEGDGGSYDILESLTAVTEAQDRLRQTAETGTLEVMLTFIVEYDMLELFCLWISRVWPDHQVFNMAPAAVDISCEDLKGPEDEQTQMAVECRRFLGKEGKDFLEHRERYLLELIGEMMWMEQNIHP
ncbi:hypothetical protein BDW59DRAFT_154896 [Aspergillus cavernicola]|uniref:Integral membrane protein n=1 Tax=Aspergillus cavernicola TaxID=176166 RepID=A0ABR4HCW4_9EURO